MTSRLARWNGCGRKPGDVEVDRFNLLNEFNLLRIMCGAFLIPHIIGKFFEPASANFFIAAKFNPPKPWMYLAGSIETVLAIGLIFGILTPYVAALACLHLLVAAAATYKVTRKWLWHIGGAEYCVFWALACLVVAMHG
jgi:putative oxidoreductase